MAQSYGDYGTGLTNEQSWCDNQLGRKIFLSKVSRRVLWFSEPPIRQIMGPLLLGKAACASNSTLTTIQCWI